MVRIFAVFALATLLGAAPALAQDATAPVHKHKHNAAAAAPASDAPASAEKATDVPDGPLDVPRWMGHAVDNILSGEGPTDK